MNHKLRTKRFPLSPTYTQLQVIVCKDMAKIERFLKKQKYDLSHEADLFNHHDFSGVVLIAKKAGEVAPDIIVILENFDLSLIAHEAIHVSWELNEISGGLFNYETQETQAYLVDYIVNKVMEMKKS